MDRSESDDTTSNVIPFKARDQTPEEIARAAERSRERLERRHAALVAALDARGRMTSAEDMKVVARNLWGILDRFEKSGGTKKSVLRAAGMGKEEDSTKQLHNYTLPPDAAFETRKLIASVRKYRALAEHAARIANWNESEILLDLFHGSTYDPGEPHTSEPHVVTSLPAYAYSMHGILDRMKHWLMRNSEIEWYYDALNKHRGIHDEWGNFWVHAVLWSSPIDSMDGVSAVQRYGRAIPGLPLYRMKVAEFPVELAVETYSEDDWSEPPIDQVKHLIYRRFFEVRIALAPVGTSGRIGIVFDQRRLDEVWDEERQRYYAPTYFGPFPGPRSRRGPRHGPKWDTMDIWECPGDVSVSVVDGSTTEPHLGFSGHTGWLRFPLFKELPPNQLFEKPEHLQMKLSQDDFYEYFGRVSNGQLLEECGPRTCKKYLDVFPEAGDLELMFEVPEVAVATEAPGDTIASCFERNLYSTDIEGEPRISTLLMQEIEQRCNLLRECIDRRCRYVEEKRSSLFSQWDAEIG